MKNTLGAFVLALIGMALLASGGQAKPSPKDRPPPKTHRHKSHLTRPRKVQVRPNLAGGYVPATTSWPWVSLLQTDQGARCTGSLIAPQRILTAAHCFIENGKFVNPANVWTVYVNRRNPSLPGEARRVTAVIVHPQYDAAGRNDVAIMFLDRPVTDVPLAPIGVASDWGQQYATTGCGYYQNEGCYQGAEMGWGHDNFDHAHEDTATELHAGLFTLGSDSYCRVLINGQVGTFDPTLQFCAYSPTGATCITHGDSGGAMMVFSGGRWVVIGVASRYGSTYNWGNCQWLNPPTDTEGSTVITETWVAGTPIRNWITTQVNPACAGARSTASAWQTRVNNDQGSEAANQSRLPAARSWIARDRAWVRRAQRQLRHVKRFVHRERQRKLRAANANLRKANGDLRRAITYYNGVVRNINSAAADLHTASAYLASANAWVVTTCNS